MNNKLTLAVIAALSGSAIAAQATTTNDTNQVKLNASAKLVKSSPSFLKPAAFLENAKDKQGKHLYIVHLADAPVALYEGKLEQYAATKPNNHKLQTNTPKVQSYISYLDERHELFLTKARKQVPGLKPVLSYKLAFNGMAIKVTQEEAKSIAKVPGVLKVVKDRIYKLDTDTGPSLVGAPKVWDGTAQESGVGTYGEGVVVGIIDSGINTDHPSFADIAGDGYDHTNPLGSGVYLGDCAGSFASLCNDKLIGVYSYSVITDEYADTEVFPSDLPRNGEDYGGHGTHVASTAAGNILLEVAESLPEFGAIESSGVETGLIFPRISGVAPRANIISYQVCWGGRTDADDTYGDCSGTAINAAIEDAIKDQVDIINYSISGGFQPWESSTELAFLSARNAGIFVATSAGNSGPDAGSTSKHAPWYTAVAASEHGRTVGYEKQLNNFTGGDSSLGTIVGTSNSGGISAPIVYAGDFTNPNDPNNDPAQCLQPFPADTFSGQIVVCDRGEIARVDKAVNVKAGGAGGYVLANVVGGADNLANDQYVVPGIHISAASSTLLRAWLASGSDHAATITASSGGLVIDPTRVDVLANFSSKGPNGSISTLTPTIGGPGVEIYAAYADQQFGHDGHEPSAGDFSYLSGTSMSSPHIAGAAALVKAAKPSWTPDNIRSALAMTASRTVKKEDGVTSADWFDSGSGRVQVDKAVEAGLVMDETAGNYTAADPSQGGDPRTLNLPSVTDNQCEITCSWNRTFTATKSGTWNVTTESISSGIQITTTPTSFTLDAGETQSVSINIDISNANSFDWLFGAVVLSANGQPDLHIPVSALTGSDSIPEEMSLTANRAADSFLIKDVESASQTDFMATTLGFTQATEINASIVQDDTPDMAFDNIEQGVDVYEIDIDSSHVGIVAQITESSASDLDLFLLFDANGNDIIEESELISRSITSGVVEFVDSIDLQVGKYWIVVQNYQASATDQADDYRLYYAAVSAANEAVSLDFSVPSSVSFGTKFDIRANWDLANAAINDRFYGLVSFGTASDPDASGFSKVQIVREEQDVTLRSNANFIVIGESTEFEIAVKGTPSPEDRNYDITLPIPNGFSLVTSSVTDGGAITDTEVNWTVTKQTIDTQDTLITFELIPSSTITEEDLTFSLSSDVTNIQAAQVETSIITPSLQFDRAPTVTIDGSSTATLQIVETQTIDITASVDEPNGEAVSISWQQISGPSATLANVDSATLQFTAPSVDSEQVLVLEVTAMDPQGNSDTATVSITVSNNEAPTLNVSAPTSVTGGRSYTVSVTVNDPENDAVTVTINGQAGTSYTRVAPNSPGTLSINIIASDGINEVSQTVSISVVAAPSSGGNSGGSGGGSMGWITIFLLPFIIRRLKVKKAA